MEKKKEKVKAAKSPPEKVSEEQREQIERHRAFGRKLAKSMADSLNQNAVKADRK